MAATVNISAQFLEVTDVGDVIVTDTQQSPDGDYVRDLRVYSRPTGSDEAKALLVQIRIRAMTREMLEITAPPQNF